MFGTVDVVAQSAPVHGAFDPWLVLLWLVLMAGCLMAVAGIVAVVRVASALLRKRSRLQRPVRIPVHPGGPANP